MCPCIPKEMFYALLGCPNRTQILVDCGDFTFMCLERAQLCDGVIDCPNIERDEFAYVCLDLGEFPQSLPDACRPLKRVNLNILINTNSGGSRGGAPPSGRH